MIPQGVIDAVKKFRESQKTPISDIIKSVQNFQKQGNQFLTKNVNQFKTGFQDPYSNKLNQSFAKSAGQFVGGSPVEGVIPLVAGLGTIVKGVKNLKGGKLISKVDDVARAVKGKLPEGATSKLGLLGYDTKSARAWRKRTDEYLLANQIGGDFHVGGAIDPTLKQLAEQRSDLRLKLLNNGVSYDELNKTKTLKDLQVLEKKYIKPKLPPQLDDLVKNLPEQLRPSLHKEPFMDNLTMYQGIKKTPKNWDSWTDKGFIPGEGPDFILKGNFSPDGEIVSHSGFIKTEILGDITRGEPETYLIGAYDKQGNLFGKYDNPKQAMDAVEYIYNKSTPVLKPLDDLAKEARKYKSAEELRLNLTKDEFGRDVGNITKGKNKIGEIRVEKDYFGKGDVHIQYIGINPKFQRQGSATEALRQVVKQNPQAKSFSAEPTSKTAYNTFKKAYGKPSGISNDIRVLSEKEALDLLPDHPQLNQGGELDTTQRVFIRYDNPKSITDIYNQAKGVDAVKAVRAVRKE